MNSCLSKKRSANPPPLNVTAKSTSRRIDHRKVYERVTARVSLALALENFSRHDGVGICATFFRCCSAPAMNENRRVIIPSAKFDNVVLHKFAVRNKDGGFGEFSDLCVTPADALDVTFFASRKFYVMANLQRAVDLDR
jgi:hypothetical protein